MPTLTTATIEADQDPTFFALFSAVRSDELGMQAWDARLRDQILRLQFVAQRSGYRQQYPAIVEQFILRDGEAIGWIMVSHGPVVCCVDLAVVSEERRRGVATWALRDLQNQAAARGVPLVLSVLRTNAPALALYERLGFRSAGENDTHVFLDWREVGAATFRRHIATTFVADPGALKIPLLLADVVDDLVSGGMEQFSLFFHGPADRLLPQGTYGLEHAALGSLALFLVPVVGSNRDRIVYQACFTRPVASDRCVAHDG